MERIKYFLTRLPAWTLSVLCFLAICWLTLSPDPLGDEYMPLFPGADKIAHGLMFGGFTFCIMVDCLRRKDWPGGMQAIKISFIAPVIPCIVGIATEFLQGEMEVGRSFEFWDMVADICGAWLVAAIFVIIFAGKAKMQ